MSDDHDEPTDEAEEPTGEPADGSTESDEAMSTDEEPAADAGSPEPTETPPEDAPEVSFGDDEPGGDLLDDVQSALDDSPEEEPGFESMLSDDSDESGADEPLDPAGSNESSDDFTADEASDDPPAESPDESDEPGDESAGSDDTEAPTDDSAIITDESSLGSGMMGDPLGSSTGGETGSPVDEMAPPFEGQTDDQATDEPPIEPGDDPAVDPSPDDAAVEPGDDPAVDPSPDDAAVEPGDDADATDPEAGSDHEITPAESPREDTPLSELLTEMETEVREDSDTAVDGPKIDWNELADQEGFEQPRQDTGAETVDPEAEEHIVDKREYCQRCEYFGEPPELHCTNEGTEILEVVDSEHFRVRSCPMIGEDGPTFEGG